MFDFKRLVVKYLRDIADKIDTNTSELSEDQVMDILRVIAHEPLTKAEACLFLNMSRSKFDSLVEEGELPKGKKRVGLSNLTWWKDELLLSKKKK